MAKQNRPPDLRTPEQVLDASALRLAKGMEVLAAAREGKPGVRFDKDGNVQVASIYPGGKPRKRQEHALSRKDAPYWLFVGLGISVQANTKSEARARLKGLGHGIPKGAEIRRLKEG